MDRIIATNSVTLSGADTAPGSGTPQYATSGNPTTSTPATTLPAYWVNMVQEEIRNVVTLAGLTPSSTAWNQLATAIQSLIAASATGKVFIGGTTTGSANVQAVATQQGNFANSAGNILTWKAGFTNTGAMTLQGDSASAISVKKRATSGLVDPSANDIVAGEEYMSICDGTVHQLIAPASNAAAFLQAANNFTDLGSINTALGTLGFASGSGYFKIANAVDHTKPFIVQYGTTPGSGGATETVTLPITFPNTFFGAVAISNNYSHAGAWFITACSVINTSSFTAGYGGGSTPSFYIAIGQ